MIRPEPGYVELARSGELARRVVAALEHGLCGVGRRAVVSS